MIDTDCELTGCTVRALRGREAGRLYIVVGGDGAGNGGTQKQRRVYIADGRHRRMSRPKLKSVRHTEIISDSDSVRIRQMIVDGKFTDGDARRAIFSAAKPPKGESDAEG